MKISYTKDTGKNATVAYFAKITASDRSLITHNLVTLLTEITEHSVLDDAAWHTARQKDQKFWGRGRYFGTWQPNTMISVLGGIIDKLVVKGGDLTDRQVTHVNRLFEVADEMQQQGLLRKPVTIIELESREAARQGVSALRDRLFHE